jgi:hypothetical protein
LLERRVGLLDAQLVVARLDARDELAFADDAAEVYGDALKAARYFDADGRLVEGGERAVDGDGLPDRHLLDARGANLTRLALAAAAARPLLLRADRVVALTGGAGEGRERQDEQAYGRAARLRRGRR